MLSEWKECKLKDAIGQIIDNRGKNPPYSNKGYEVIETGCISGSNKYPDYSIVKKFVDQNTFDNWFRSGHPQKGDLLIITVGNNIGAVSIMPENRGVLTQNLIGLRASSQFEPHFLYYSLCQYHIQYYLSSLNIGSAQPSIKVPHLLNTIILAPPLSEQKAIAHILGSLDDKIELNRKMNETLEAMAQALFKSWFVDFDPVIDNAIAAGNEIPEELADRAEQRKALGDKRKKLPPEIQKLFPSEFIFTDELGWIPKGWGTGLMSEIAEVKYGKDHKKLPDGNIPVYGSGGIMRFANKAICETASVLIPRKGTLSNLMYVDEPFWSVDTMFFTLFKEEFHVRFLYYFLQKFNFTEMNVGSAVPSMTTKVLNNINILIPTHKILEAFDKELNDIYHKKKNNENQIQALSKLRDTLLPKLLSGEIRINKAEKLVKTLT